MEEEIVEGEMNAVDAFVNTPVEGLEKKPKKEKDKNEEGTLKKIWNRTIFPDKIKQNKEINKIKREAKIEAMKELKPELVKKIKQDELDKLTGKKKKDFLEKLSKGFEGVGENLDVDKLLGTGGQTKTKDISGMMGMGKDTKNKDIIGMMGQETQGKNEQPFSDEKMSKLLGTRDTGISGQDKVNKMLNSQQQSSKKEESPEDKIKRMLE